jgi:hypothetical protein
MSTTTTNLGLVKPAYSDTADVQVLNENADKIDAELWKTYNDLGIVVNGNKAALSAAVGQFIILKNSTISSRSDGLYKAAKAIPANTTIDSTYLTAVPRGGLNAVQNTITRKIRDYSSVTIPSTGYIKIDSYEDMGIETTKYLLSMMFRGWEAHLENLTLAKSSTGLDVYMLGPAGTTATNVSVEYFFVDHL